MATATAPLTGAPGQVLHALENPKYVWRTVDGLVQETKLPRDRVLGILSELPSEDIVTTPSKSGQLYSTRRHYRQHRSFLSRVLSVIADMPK